MAEPDFTACWYALKASVAEGKDRRHSKRSWGADELLAEMSLIEAHNLIPQEGYSDRPPIRPSTARAAHAA